MQTFICTSVSKTQQLIYLTGRRGEGHLEGREAEQGRRLDRHHLQEDRHQARVQLLMYKYVKNVGG